MEYWALDVIAYCFLAVLLLLILIGVLGLIPLWKEIKRKEDKSPRVLISNFMQCNTDELITKTKAYPIRTRADLQVVLNGIIDGLNVVRWHGINHSGYLSGALDLASLLENEGYHETKIAPPSYEDVDIGDDEHVRCFACTCLWLIRNKEQEMVLLFGVAEMHGTPAGYRLEIAVAPDGDTKIVDDIYASIDEGLRKSSCYRGKVLSLEQPDHCGDNSTGIAVHQLKSVSADELILSDKTRAMVERNVIEFISMRDRLAEGGQNLHKGLLFHGPPGTGKTHCIRHLIGALEDHTTFLVAADSLGLLEQYMQLARLLEPAIIVLEDVDLIARHRHELGVGQESLLNVLLNEMDGLQSDARIIFILTTNAPEEIESALAARPGRIDQAIEFPLPDEENRKALIHLYKGECEIEEADINDLARRTKQSSAAFIKELMRKAAQNAIRRDDSTKITDLDCNEALEDILAGGGELAKRLLGAEELGFSQD